MQSLINARLKAKLTQAELAALLGVAEATVCRYERGTRHPQIKIARALNKMFKIPMAVLMPEIFDKNHGENTG